MKSGQVCHQCHGGGAMRKSSDFENGYWMDCPVCQGTGKLRPSVESNSEGIQEGPILTDQDGSLDTPILMCKYGKNRCKHFGVRDEHHFYCSAQDASNISVGPAYPWAGEEKRLQSQRPDSGCPF